MLPLETPTDGLTLAGQDVHIWLTGFDLPADSVSALAATLWPEERERADRFVRAQDRNAFVITRGVLRHILGQYLGVAPQDCKLGRTPHGKPFLLGPPASDLQFNASHADGLAVVGVTRGRAIGVDIEKIRADVDMEEVGRIVFSQAERDALRTLPQTGRLPAFFRRWTCKEAYLKCVGVGFLESSDRITAPIPDASYLVTNLRLALDYAVALAVEGDCVQLRCFRWGPSLATRQGVTYNNCADVTP